LEEPDREADIALSSEERSDGENLRKIKDLPDWFEHPDLRTV
jgi:hypothetical protein